MFGGAGFIGSHIVSRLAGRGDEVVVVDGLMPQTGGSLTHLEGIDGSVHVEPSPIETIANLDALLDGASVIVDCMAWTRHVAALDDPLYDVRLNLESHLHLLAAARQHPEATIVYLGSRSQYGAVPGEVITEDTPLVPRDVQGIHKAAADHHFRVNAMMYGLNVASVRLPNCFGERQPATGADIGLIGGFIRTLLAGGAVSVYGRGRRRALLYAGDAAEIVARICERSIAGFTALNVPGEEVELLELATELAALIGGGTVVCEPMPASLAAIDGGEASMDGSRLTELIGALPRRDRRAALAATVDYFRSRVRDLAL